MVTPKSFTNDTSLTLKKKKNCYVFDLVLLFFKMRLAGEKKHYNRIIISISVFVTEKIMSIHWGRSTGVGFC